MLLKKLKYALRRKALARAGIVEEEECTKMAYGKDGGAWMVCPVGLDQQSVVYSFGVGDDISFDLELIEKEHVTVHAFDPTPGAVEWVKRQTLPPEFHFHPVGLADKDGEVAFHPPRKAESVHYTPVQRYRKPVGEPVKAPVKTLRSLMGELGHEHIDVLKIDIEGGEYAVIEQMIREKVPVQQLLVEFHHVYETIPFSKTVKAFHALREYGFRLFHLSERGYEMSFIYFGDWPPE